MSPQHSHSQQTKQQLITTSTIIASASLIITIFILILNLSTLLRLPSLTQRGSIIIINNISNYDNIEEDHLFYTSGRDVVLIKRSIRITNRKILSSPSSSSSSSSSTSTSSQFDFTPFLHRMQGVEKDQGNNEVDPIYGMEKRLVPTGPNPLHH